MKLTKDNIRDGLKIACDAHPEWGTFIVTHDRNGWIRKSDRGSAMLFDYDFPFWSIV